MKPAKVLERFGEFLAPILLADYKFLLNPNWNAEQMLLNTEFVVHQAVRAGEPDASPPRLKFESIRPGELRLIYYSPRNYFRWPKVWSAGSPTTTVRSWQWRGARRSPAPVSC